MSMNTSLQALNTVNFFMADVQGGLGPYLGVFLQHHERRQERASHSGRGRFAHGVR